MRRRPDRETEELASARLRRALGAGGWVPDDVPPAPAEEPDRRSWSGAEEPPAPANQPDRRSWSAAEEPPAPAPAGLTALLPGTVRGGRLDPGRRGAVALVVVAVLAALVTAVVVHRSRPQEVAAPAVERLGTSLPGADETPDPAAQLVVSVAGTVVTPGLVRLPAGSRVDDALRAAGGLSPGADPGLLNLARKLVDGEQVLVGVGPPPAAAGSGGEAGGQLDLNAATAEDLDALPGIGPVLAERVVDWRTENGPFRSVDQLREVPGIGEAKYAVLEKKVRV